MTGLSVPATLTAGQTTTFTAKFSPTAAGAATGNISIASNAPGSPLAIALTGSGTTGQAQLTMSPASVSYGNVAVGSSATQTITLTNSGNATLTVSQASASGTGFSVSGASWPMTINAGSSASFPAVFAPTSASAATGSISVVSNAPGSPAAIALSGTGVQGQLGASPASVNFGSVNVGSSGSQTVTLTNSGSASLTISQATAPGTGLQREWNHHAGDARCRPKHVVHSQVFTDLRRQRQRQRVHRKQWPELTNQRRAKRVRNRDRASTFNQPC